MDRSQCKNTINNSEGNMAAPEPNNPTTAITRYPNIPEHEKMPLNPI